MKSKNIFYLFILFIFSLSSCKKDFPKINNSENEKIYKKGVLPNKSSCKYCDKLFPIGGGNGYTQILSTGTIIINSHSSGIPKTPIQLGIELQDAVSSSSDGDVIFIESDCIIEVTSTITISKKITIASNRGLSGLDGALIHYNPINPNDTSPLFKINSNIIRITGLRIKGHMDYSYGIEMYNYKNIRIDNNEFYDWMDAIRVSEFHPVNSSNEENLLSEYIYSISHNYFHDNKYGDGHLRGYGIMVWNAFVQIFANQFEFNRHDIAGVGSKNSGFNLYCNIFGKPAYTVAFVDMHGDHGNTEDWAGGFMRVHHNDFLEKNPQASIFPVGRPTTLMLIDNNKFADGTIYWNSSCAIQQTVCCGKANTSNAYGNLIAVNNIYNNSYLGWYVKENWDNESNDNFFRIPSTNDLLHSNLNAALDGSWIKKNKQELDYYFGDFNGDGKTDIFKCDGEKWYYLPLNTSYANNWIPLADSKYTLGSMDLLTGTSSLYTYNPKLILNNFDSDLTTDVFMANGTNWYVSYSAQTTWSVWANSAYTIPNLLFGKFHNPSKNDIITDVFRSDIPQWYISYDGTTWTPVASSGYSFNSLRVGDFNGDGNSDIFLSTGSEWFYSSNALSSWVFLNNSHLNINRIIIGDFNSDGIDDVIGFTGSWQVSLSGTQAWANLNTSNFPIINFEYGSLK